MIVTVMASSMKLGYPLNDVLPSIDHARDRLLARIYRYRHDHEASQLTTDEDCALLYGYSEYIISLKNFHFEELRGLTLIFTFTSLGDRPVVEGDHRDNCRNRAALWGSE